MRRTRQRASVPAPTLEPARSDTTLTGGLVVAANESRRCAMRRNSTPPPRRARSGLHTSTRSALNHRLVSWGRRRTPPRALGASFGGQPAFRPRSVPASEQGSRRVVLACDAPTSLRLSLQRDSARKQNAAVVPLNL